MAHTKQTAQDKSVTRPTHLTQAKMTSKQLIEPKILDRIPATSTTVEEMVSPTKRVQKDSKPKKIVTTSSDISVKKKKKRKQR